jgi:hypothetical protein
VINASGGIVNQTAIDIGNVTGATGNTACVSSGVPAACCTGSGTGTCTTGNNVAIRSAGGTLQLQGPMIVGSSTTVPTLSMEVVSSSTTTPAMQIDLTGVTVAGGSALSLFRDNVSIGAGIVRALEGTGNMIFTSDSNAGFSWMVHTGTVIQDSGARTITNGIQSYVSNVSFAGSAALTIHDSAVGWQNGAFIASPGWAGTGTSTMDSYTAFGHLPIVVFGTVGANWTITNYRGFYFKPMPVSGAVTNMIGVDIEAGVLTGITTPIGLRNQASTVFTGTTQNISAAGNTITCLNTTSSRLSNSSGGAIDLTSNPQVADGQDGQICIIQVISTNTVKIDDGTGLQLAGGVSFTMGQGDILALQYNSGLGDWYEMYRADN